MDYKIHQVLEHTHKQSPDMEDLEDPMYQSDASMNFDVFNTNSIGSLDDSSGATPLRNVIPIPVPVTSLTKSQKRSAKKKARKEKQKLQLQTPSGLDEQVVPTFSTESPEYTPLSLLVQGRQWKEVKTELKETDNYLKNGNVIITRYYPQGEEQAQLLDLVIYDILAKWDNYTLLANLG
ncbi:hypothetical protein RclHR1_18320002 [Rhizophagus clarus]|uniref:Uncharacterized protein n=1 Tax=Rhizophagus clarus TaxID=94130 RepID=A0A2Z6QZJ0_9GLOM|nr:hypothetical protein RclHR1_18320002 [Rhizophagus clarus]